MILYSLRRNYTFQESIKNVTPRENHKMSLKQHWCYCTYKAVDYQYEERFRCHLLKINKISSVSCIFLAFMVLSAFAAFHIYTITELLGNKLLHTSAEMISYRQNAIRPV